MRTTAPAPRPAAPRRRLGRARTPGAARDAVLGTLDATMPGGADVPRLGFAHQPDIDAELVRCTWRGW